MADLGRIGYGSRVCAAEVHSGVGVGSVRNQEQETAMYDQPDDDLELCLQRKEHRYDGFATTGWCQLERDHDGNCDADAVGGGSDGC